MSLKKRKDPYKPPRRQHKAKKEYLLRAPACMAEERAISREYLVNGGVITDRRESERLVRRFVARNQELLDFLGLKMRDGGEGQNFKLLYQTSNYVGAIPTLLPDNTQGGDIQIYPRFVNQRKTNHAETDGAAEEEAVVDSKQEAYTKLIEMLQLLDHAVTTEYHESIPLKHGNELRPPLYMEAAKFVDLYDRAIKENWRKFRVERRQHPYPKSGTDWGKYAQRIADPKNMLIFPSRDNTLTVDHPEWRQIKYAFTLARQELSQTTTPLGLKYFYQEKLRTLSKKVQSIAPEQTKSIPIHASDPESIRVIKQQANILLSGKSNTYCAWRIDIAEVFERYVQHVLTAAMKSAQGRVHCNSKISGSGAIPKWGLKYLEPDFLIQTQDQLIIADAKYKANLYAHQKNSKNSGFDFKEIFRHDLHQVLAYCAFAPQKNKLAMLCYPSYGEVQVMPMRYTEQSFWITNTVLIVGLPFDAATVENTIKAVQEKIVDVYIRKENM